MHQQMVANHFPPHTGSLESRTGSKISYKLSKSTVSQDCFPRIQICMCIVCISLNEEHLPALNFLTRSICIHYIPQPGTFAIITSLNQEHLLSLYPSSRNICRHYIPQPETFARIISLNKEHLSELQFSTWNICHHNIPQNNY